MITGIILTKNEEEHIVDCIKSVLFCDEIIIVDDNSEDNTIDLVKETYKERVKIKTHLLKDDFAAQRNFALTLAKSEWVLFLDADEKISDNLEKEIKNMLIATPGDVNGFLFKRKDIMWGKEIGYGEVGALRLLRLARKNAGIWEGKVHEKWNIKGRIVELKSPIIHSPHQSIREFIQEIDNYSTIRARELFDKKVHANFFSILFYPKIKFIQNYILRQGYKDGREGFMYAMLMSLHSFLVRSKLFLLEHAR